MSRLQVGGLALVIKAINPNNVGVIVELVGHGDIYDWIVEGDLSDSHRIHNQGKVIFVADSDQLLPLGDEEGRKLYKLEEELLEKEIETA